MQRPPRPLQAYWVPSLPSDYFETAERWWSQPDHSGHGPFDLLTPPLADAWLRANASAALCDALASFLEAAPGGMARCSNGDVAISQPAWQFGAALQPAEQLGAALWR